MSYIYFDINGRLREYVTTPKRKGSENVDTLCVYWEGNDGTIVLPSQCFIEYGHESIHAGPLTANKISRTIIPFERERDLKFFQYGKTYQFMCFDLPTAVSSTSGFWHSSVSIHDRLSNNVVQVLGDITFEVEESSIVPSGSLNLSQYNYILDNIKDVEGNLDSKLDKTTPTSIIDGNGDKVVDFAWDKVTIHKKAQTIETPIEAKDVANKEYVDSKVSTETEGVVKSGDLKTLNGESLLGSGDIAYDASLSSTSTNAVQNKVINSTISELSYQLAMVRENLFQTVLSEIDYTEDFATLYAIPDTLSDTDGTHRVLFSETQLREVAGNSIAYNQGAVLKSTITSHGITLTNNGDGSMTISGTADKDVDLVVCEYAAEKDRKYLITGGYENSAYNSNVWSYSNSQTIKGQTLITSTASNIHMQFLWRIKNGFTIETKKIIPMVFDLTLMGLDSVSTVEEAKSELLKRGIDIDQYNPFSEGEIRNTTASGIKVNGYNLFDEEFEGGAYSGSTGLKESGQNAFRSVGYTKVTPGKKYTLYFENIMPGGAYVSEYDKDKRYIKRTSSDTVFDLTLTSSTQYITIFYYKSGSNWSSNVPTNSNTCFHLSTLRTGYAPYKEPKAISFASTELLGAGDAHDTIEVVEGDKVAGIQRYNLVHVKRVGTVDLGTLSWTYNEDRGRFSSSNLPQQTIGSTSGLYIANIRCSKYVTGSVNDVYNGVLGGGKDKCIALSTGTINFYLYLNDSSYTDVTAFKAAMSGVILNYELATPTRTTIAENLTFEEVSATIEQGGSIESVYETLAPNCTTGFVVKKATEVSK